MHYPIILIPGIARFDFLRQYWLQRLSFFLSDRTLQGDRTHYFRRIRPYLQSHGYTVEHTHTGFAEDIRIRADRLAATILLVTQKHNAAKVHLIGHSMGGLDARYTAVNTPHISDKIATITTIGTPHHGTSFADYALRLGADELIALGKQLFCIDFRGFLTITTHAMQTFNENGRNHEAQNNITYFTYTAHQQKENIFFPLQDAWTHVAQAEGDNDGLVSVTSQAWDAQINGDDGTRKTIQQRRFPVPTDHLNEVGWWDINEWQNIRFWQFTHLRQRTQYEQQLRNVYLKIAQETASIE